MFNYQKRDFSSLGVLADFSYLALSSTMEVEDELVLGQTPKFVL